jgi:hypothetical protein
LKSVLLLAIKTGWSRQEILALPKSEFNFYLSNLTKADGNE